MTLVAVDTSVAVPLLVTTHPSYEHLGDWATGRTLGIPGHALAETYSVLTRLPGDLRVTPGDAVRIIRESFPTALVLPEEDAADLPHVLAALGVSGGATYDGMVALAALRHDVPLATRDARARITYEAVGVRVLLLRA